MKKKTIIILLIIAGMNPGLQSQIDIYHHVPFIPQPTQCSCWSSSIAMILWWRDCEDAQMCLPDALTPEQVALDIGYWQEQFQTGMDAEDTFPLEYYNLVTVQPMSFPVETLAGFSPPRTRVGCILWMCKSSIQMWTCSGSGRYDRRRYTPGNRSNPA
jgi:hypothetical protein